LIQRFGLLTVIVTADSIW